MYLLIIVYGLIDLLALSREVLEGDILQTRVLHVPVRVLVAEFHEFIVSWLKLFLLPFCHPGRLDVAGGARLAPTRNSSL